MLNIAVSDDVEPQPRYLVAPLESNTHYVLRVTAHNSAGSTAHEYTFNTLLGGELNTVYE
jgi:hypothetical protein